MESQAVATQVPITQLQVSAYTLPTEKPETDGTLAWDSTTLILVEVRAGNETGLGYTYSHETLAGFIHKKLAPMLQGLNALDVGAAYRKMLREVRNLGQTGLAAMAISAVDNALWDLKARLLHLPLVKVLGQLRQEMPLYASGGFTSYSLAELKEQFSGWAEAGFKSMKMKVGREPEEDLRRVVTARKAVGDKIALFVDANGAYSGKQALYFAEAFADVGVCWFEEPLSSDDLNGLRRLRERAPAGMDIAAGEYGFTLSYFQHMLQAQAVDVLQADATRCCGISGFLKAASLCEASHLPFSSHTAPAQHLHAALAAPAFIHAEYFYDHVRIERKLFDGLPEVQNGKLSPDLSRSGNGLIFKRKDAEQYAC